jgi:hypothetical protein
MEEAIELMRRRPHLGPLGPGAAMELVEVKRRYGDPACVLGN